MSFLSSVRNYFNPQVPQYCHGTTFSTLYMMGQQTGDDENCLLPFGELAKKNTLCFAGECFRGITDAGHNHIYTSWTSLQQSSTAESYATGFPFQPENILKKFQKIIVDSDQASSDRMAPYCIEGHSAYWNQMILHLRQYRAWDEESFQRDLAPGLQRWLGKIIPFFEINGAHYNGSDVAAAALGKMKSLQKELAEPPVHQIKPQDREHILNGYPIVFITSIPQADDFISNEYLFSRKMKVGRDIPWMATDAPHIGVLQKYLQQKNLARKVSVISFDTLKQMREHPPIQESLSQRISTHFKTYRKTYLGAALIVAIGIAAKIQLKASS